MSLLKSEASPLEDVRVAYAAAEAVRKAHAVGLVREAPDVTALTFPAVKSVVASVRKAGIAQRAARDLDRAAPSDVDAILRDLREIDAVLEESPLPATEWRRLLEVLGRDQLARLTGVSPSSVARYAGGARDTPDDVAARVHFLALVVGDLAGAYDEIGIRRWFDRARSALEGQTPAELLRGRWHLDQPGPAQIRALARSLVESPAT
jgi:hypothetical protein